MCLSLLTPSCSPPLAPPFLTVRLPPIHPRAEVGQTSSGGLKSLNVAPARSPLSNEGPWAVKVSFGVPRAPQIDAKINASSPLRSISCTNLPTWSWTHYLLCILHIHHPHTQCFFLPMWSKKTHAPIMCRFLSSEGAAKHLLGDNWVPCDSTYAPVAAKITP